MKPKSRAAASAGNPAPERRHERLLHRAYLLGVWLKGIDGVLEVIGGVLFLVISKSALAAWIVHLTQHELATDPGDWVATHLRQAVSHLSSNTKLFASAYLLGHGAIKVFLVWGGLLRGKLWAFPTALIIIAAFVGYQSYRILHHYSLGLILLTAVDVIVWGLIWREYRLAKKR